MRILLWAPFGAGEHYWGPGTSAYRLFGCSLLENITLDLAHGFENQKDPKNIFSKIFFISNLKQKRFFSTLKFLIYSWFFVYKHYKEYDVVYCLGAFEISFRPALWFESRGVRSFCKITDEKGGIKEHSFISRVFGISNNRRKRINDISGYISISSKIRDLLLDIGVHPEKIFYIPNGVNTDTFKPANNEYEKEILRKRYGFNINQFIVLFVGGISARKRPFELIKVFHELLYSNEIPNIHLILLGPDRSGKEKLLETINIFIDNNNIGNFITHFEHSHNPQDFYRMADIFVLPSLSEGLSNAVLEAASSGLPSIVSPSSGMNDIISQNKNGFIVELSNFNDKIRFYALNRDLLKIHGNNARNTIINKFDSKNVLIKLIHVFSNDNI